MLIRAEDSFLLVVDVQERLVPAVLDPERTLANVGRLVSGAMRLKVPVILTEHCPQQIGRVLPEVRDRVPATSIVEKSCFSAQAESAGAARIAALERFQPIVAGTEAHVCVLQTALDLAAAGYRPFVVADAVSSRHAANRDLALSRMREAGVGVVSTEMVLFEWLARADHEAFRDLLPLIKDTGTPGFRNAGE